MNPRLPERGVAAAAVRRQGMRRRQTLMQRMLDIQQRERAAIVGEFGKVKGLMPLLMKHRNGTTWTRAERRQLHDQLRALAHLSPYLFILILPGSFALLPVYAWWLDRRRTRRT